MKDRGSDADHGGGGEQFDEGVRKRQKQQAAQRHRHPGRERIWHGLATGIEPDERLRKTEAVH